MKEDDLPDRLPHPDDVANNRLDEMADFHQRLSVLETAHLKLSRRVTRVEDHSRGGFTGDDPLSGMFTPGMIWAIIVISLAPLALEFIKTWRSSSSSA